MVRLLLAGLLLVGCAGAQGGASYSGSREARLTTAARVGDVPSVPAGYERLGSVSARCRLPRDYQVLDDEPLANVDCSEERLGRALRERAAEVGGELLVGRECNRSGRERRCDADVARPGDALLKARRPEATPSAAPAPAPGPDAVAELDEPRVSRSWAILLSFESEVPRERPSLAPAELGRSGDRPAQYEELGDMTARCERDDCEPEELAHALRVAAARVGARHLSQVRCFEDRRGPSCVGALGVEALPPRQ